MELDKTYDSDNSSSHLLFIRILEENQDILKKVVARSNIDNYNNGPYIRFKVTNNPTIMNYIRRKSTVISTIRDTYSKMISFLSTSLYNYYDFARIDNIIDIYYSNDSGVQIILEHYLVVSQYMMDMVLSEYNQPFSTTGESNNTNTNNVDSEDKGFLSYALSFIF